MRGQAFGSGLASFWIPVPGTSGAGLLTHRQLDLLDPQVQEGSEADPRPGAGLFGRSRG